MANAKASTSLFLDDDLVIISPTSRLLERLKSGRSVLSDNLERGKQGMTDGETYPTVPRHGHLNWVTDC